MKDGRCRRAKTLYIELAWLLKDKPMGVSVGQFSELPSKLCFT